MLVPSGGLANRMRAIASAYQLAAETGSQLQVVWFQDWGLGAPFHALFEQPHDLSLREATLKDKLIYDRPRRKNFWLPSLPQQFLFERCLREDDIGNLKKKNFDFASWLQGHRCYMSCFGLISEVNPALFQKLFVPVAAIHEVVKSYEEQFSDYTIGVHIRRTDHSIAILQSPDELFLERVKHEIDLHHDTKVFLATDSNDVKSTFVAAFGNRVVMQPDESSRSSIDGIRSGLVDMYTLSLTKKIYGSAFSTFSMVAASLGDNQLEILTKK